MKHVLATTASHRENQRNLTPDEVKSLITTIPTLPSTSKGMGNFQERAIGIFEKMNSTNLMKCFERNNELFQNLDNQFDRLINKLYSSLCYSTSDSKLELYLTNWMLDFFTQISFVKAFG